MFDPGNLLVIKCLSLLVRPKQHTSDLSLESDEPISHPRLIFFKINCIIFLPFTHRPSKICKHFYFLLCMLYMYALSPSPFLPLDLTTRFGAAHYSIFCGLCCVSQDHMLP
jgi:hypothetical protein